MKAITLYQPWASLVAVGAKRIETRSWSTPYRGPLTIHAAKTIPRWVEAIWATDTAFRKAALVALSQEYPNTRWPAHLPCGSVVAVTRLVACVSVPSMRGHGCLHGSPVLSVCHICGAVGGYVEAGNQPLTCHHDRRPALVPPFTGQRELLFGDFTPGHYAWILADVKPLDTPIPARGMQGLWDWEAD